MSEKPTHGWCVKCTQIVTRNIVNGELVCHQCHSEILKNKAPVATDYLANYDSVTKPRHYKYHDLDTFDFLKGGFAPEVLEGFLVGNIIKYIQRYPLKNGLEDIKKAQKYLEKLIEIKTKDLD